MITDGMKRNHIKLCDFVTSSDEVKLSTVQNQEQDQMDLDTEEVCERKILKARFRVSSQEVKNTKELIQDMNSLLQSGAYSDILLSCESEVYKAHKSILSTRSPVFSAMFCNPMKERDQEYVDIQGIKPPILQLMLRYIYSGQTELLNVSLACELLLAADMYQLTGLKKICIDYLQYSICKENVLQILKVAYLFDESLQTEAYNFICSNYESFENTQEWNELRYEHPQLVINVMALKIKMLQGSNTSDDLCADGEFVQRVRKKLSKYAKK